jgi:hypothetical protein
VSDGLMDSRPAVYHRLHHPPPSVMFALSVIFPAILLFRQRGFFPVFPAKKHYLNLLDLAVLQNLRQSTLVVNYVLLYTWKVKVLFRSVRQLENSLTWEDGTSQIPEQVGLIAGK